jgi:ATP-dependent Lon protease
MAANPERETPELAELLRGLPDELPIMPLRGTVVFPLAVVPLQVGQPRSLRLLDDVMRGGRVLGLVGQRHPEAENAGPDDCYTVGTVGRIVQLLRQPEGGLMVAVQGLERIRITEWTEQEPYLRARYTLAPDVVEQTDEVEALRRLVADEFRRLAVLANQPEEMAVAIGDLNDPRALAYMIASSVRMDLEVRQEILELDSVTAKLQRLTRFLARELELMELGRRIQSSAQEEMTKTQREYFLREQLRAIRKELGEGESPDETADLRARLEATPLPEEARREAERELARLESLPAASPEHGIIRNYLDWIVSLPWNKPTGAPIDVALARQVLDEDHYDLDKIKDRILEYLAVRKLKDERDPPPPPPLPKGEGGEDARVAAAPPSHSGGDAEYGERRRAGGLGYDDTLREPILCFVGPPGVGKTSLAQSIARALGRKYVRISLGGVRDEAEIRGHRRTYIGAMPGRIIQGLRRAEAADPVFVLDEIDKLSAGFQGDPAAALLEVLDPAQNHTFVDNYLNVPFDLSRVMFITTANAMDPVPPPLQDRMEVLQLAGYTENEKLQIAVRYLIPKQLRAHALRPDEVVFEEEAICHIIRDYTREAGVRNLEREIATCCRKAARDLAERPAGTPTAPSGNGAASTDAADAGSAARSEPGAAAAIVITSEQVIEYLGRPRFFADAAERTDRPGVATGLAWTPVGGDILFIEAARMPGQASRLILTGHLGEVMRESAQTALSYLRSDAARLGLPADVFQQQEVHVHVPAGAIPKDGPSAGITMATALASLAAQRPVRGDTAMTGEITLRGKVLPVGGIKEKVLAAHRAGLTRVILARRNERDLEDLPPEVRGALEFVLVDNVAEVLAAALGAPATKNGKAARDGKAAKDTKAARDGKAIRDTKTPKSDKAASAARSRGRASGARSRAASAG